MNYVPAIHPKSAILHYVRRRLLKAVAIVLPMCCTLGCHRARDNRSLSKPRVAPPSSVSAAPDAANATPERAAAQVRLLIEALPSVGKKKFAQVLLEITEPSRKISLGTVSGPFVGQLSVLPNRAGRITCTPDFRLTLATVTVRSDTLIVARMGRATKEVIIPLEGREVAISASEISIRDLPDSACPPSGGNAKPLIARLVSANYYPGFKRSSPFSLVVGGTIVKLTEQFEWWRGCSSRMQGSEVRISCKRNGEQKELARIWPESDRIGFEWYESTTLSGRILTPCDTRPSVSEPECFACGNMYF